MVRTTVAENLVAESPTKPSEALSLSRWSRLKREQRATQPVDAAVRPEPAEGSVASDSASEIAAKTPQSTGTIGAHLQQTPELPPLSSISLTEDFTPFMQAKVPQMLKQQALKALFKEPHFNVMDGLDIYIDDYTVFEPISAEVMDKLSAWKSIQNPLKQVVAPGGYAVDEASEEGRAVLAARARIATSGTESDHEIPPTESTGISADVEASDDERPSSTEAHESAPDIAVEQGRVETEPLLIPAVKPHPRYGKRVGDFSFVDTPADAPESSDTANVAHASDSAPTQLPEKP
jgi:Protein of unknown function (DUF3306)